MFADELAGNPAKKRADAAKARRLRAKREQEAKLLRKRREAERREREAATATAGGETASSTCQDGAGPDDIAGPVAGATPMAATATSPTTPAVAEEPPRTAAQKAAEQRKVRAEARMRTSAASRIQSLARSRSSAAKAREDQRTIFDKRMSDLIALGSLLKRTSTGVDYVPPPATTSIMTQQFLFFACPTTVKKKDSNSELTLDNTSMIMEDRDLPRWTKLLTHLLLPGVCGDDLDLDPLLPWAETVGGTRRLHKVLTLCVSSLSAKRNPSSGSRGKRRDRSNSDAGDKDGGADKCYRVVDRFLRRILRLGDSAGTERPANYHGKSRDAVCEKSRSVLLLPSANTVSKGTGKEHCLKIGRCDLLRSLRSLLLYGPANANAPIPGDADRLREKVATNDEKARATLLMGLAVDVIASLDRPGADQTILNHLCCRFIGEILTVPLLTWKVLPLAYECLLRHPVTGGTTEAPPLVAYLRRFNNVHQVSDGSIDTVLLSDISLTTCPAPAVLCLLASLVQMGRRCEALNGTNPATLDYSAAAEYYGFIATLINAAPLGTFSSRMSAVEWVSSGSSSTPIVLSSAVLEQVAALLHDSHVRALFTCAIDDEALGTAKVIRTKTDKDKKHEKDLEELGVDATAVAAQEAMVDHNRSIFSSKWAKKLQTKLTSLMSTTGQSMMQGKTATPSKGVGNLINTSSLSRQLANGKGLKDTTAMNVAPSSPGNSVIDNALHAKRPLRKYEYSVSLLLALCRVYGTIISRWGGNGQEDLVRRAQPSLDPAKRGKEGASSFAEPCVTALLNVLCFSTSFVTSSWAIIQSNPRVVSDLYSVIDVSKNATPTRALTAHPNGTGRGNVGAIVLFMFVACFSHTLIVTDDGEFLSVVFSHEGSRPTNYTPIVTPYPKRKYRIWKSLCRSTNCGGKLLSVFSLDSF